MKGLKWISLVLLFLPLTMLAQKKDSKAPKGAKEKELRHVVLIKFKDSSSPADVQKVTTAFEALKTKIKQVKKFEMGTNNSPENLNQGLTHAFLLTFATEKDRDDYLVHPIHKEFVDLAGPHIDKVTVVDYWTK